MAGAGPPVADFYANQIKGDAPFTVNFEDGSLNSPTAWAWDFTNDGTVDSTLQNPSFTYTTPGIYSVKLTVVNGFGNNSQVKINYITVTAVPIASFEGSPLVGNLPLLVQFTDTSQYQPTSWLWDFGLTGATSNLQNPTYTYTQRGNYSITLNATNEYGTGTSTILNYILVLAPPIPAFTANVLIGPYPLTVQFTDQSTYEPTQWAWDFNNDGIVDSDLQNPTYTYTQEGFYSVRLTATNDDGFNTLLKTNYIDVGPYPVPNFSADKFIGLAPLTITFTNLSQYMSSNYNPTTYIWDFKNDSTAISNQVNPTYTYQTKGFYSVKLIAQNKYGTKSVIFYDYIEVGVPPVPNFTANKTFGVLPLAIQFTSTSTSDTPILTYAWTFKNSTVESTLANPLYTYIIGTALGFYDVTLTVSNKFGSASITKPSFIEIGIPPVASFIANNVSSSTTVIIGAIPFSVQFTDTSSIGSGNYPPTSWAWDFDNGGGTDTMIQNPIYVYLFPGIYSVKFTAINKFGLSSATRTNYIDANYKPVADFSVQTGSVTTGIIPITVNFLNQTSHTGTVFNPVTYAWDLNYDGAIDSTVLNPSFTYSIVNKYTVSLTVTNKYGSDTKIKVDYINAQRPLPVANFTVADDTVKLGTPAIFTDTTTNVPIQWAWNFGAGGGTSTQQNPSYTYSAVGTYTVALVATNSTGTGSITKVNFVTVGLEPVANFTASPVKGTAPLTVQFTDTSSNTPTSWAWDFNNNGTIDSTVQNPSFTYSSLGNYTVILTATNNFGTTTISKTDFIVVGANPVPNFIYNNTTSGQIIGSLPFTVNFVDTSTSTPAPTSWAWDFDNNGSTDSTVQNPSYTYNTAGTYSVKLTVTNVLSGQSTTKNSIINIGARPVAAFTSNVVSGAVPLTVNFTDQSTNTPTSWAWDFDNNGSTDSTQQNPSYTYSSVGTYSVKLTVSNTYGSNTITKTSYIRVEMRPPVADFIFDKTSGAAPLTVNFTDKSTNSPTSWAWDFDNNGSTDSTQQNPSYTYNTAGTYSVRLVATNSSGSGSITKANIISIGSVPVADFSFTPNFGATPLTVQFTDLSTGTPTSWAWDFKNDGTATSTVKNPSYTYTISNSTQFQSFSIKLTVSNSFGTSTVTKGTVISGNKPIIDFTAGPVTGTPPLTVNFTNSTTIGDSSTYPATWAWDFKNDGTATSSQKSPSYVYSVSGIYGVKLTATNSFGTSVLTKTNLISMGGVPVANFTSTNTVGELGHIVYFTDESTNGPTTWSWRVLYSNGLVVYTSTSKSPSFTFSYSTGSYNIELTAKNSFGQNTITKNNYVDIGVKPVANFRYNNVSSGIIYGAPPFVVQFADASTNTPTSWTWDFDNNGTIDRTEANPNYTYQNKGTYTVTLSATNKYGTGSVTRSSIISVGDKPVANFSSNVTSGVVPLTINFSDTSTNNPSSWAWDFDNNGTTDSTSRNPSYTYSTGGTYSVKLTVSNSFGNASETKINYITVGGPQPVANFTFSPSSGATPLTVQFTDTSTNSPTSWAWDFDNNGTTDSTQQNPSYTYSTGGTYSVRLVATNSSCRGNLTKANIITIGSLPVADFSWTPNLGKTPLTVTVTDTSTNNPTSRVWAYSYDAVNFTTFGLGANPATGVFVSSSDTAKITIRLRSTNSFGTGEVIKINIITVGNVPNVDFIGVPTSGSSPLLVSFANTTTRYDSNSTPTWNWDFDNNGSTDSTLKDPSYTYNTPGYYSVRLSATNIFGTGTRLKSNYISMAIVPEFTATPVSGSSPLTVQFNYTTNSGYTPSQFAWDFTADGITDSTQQNPSYSYDTSGTFTVRLTVTVNGTNFSNTKSNFISVSAGGVNTLDGFYSRNSLMTNLLPSGNGVAVRYTDGQSTLATIPYQPTLRSTFGTNYNLSINNGTADDGTVVVYMPFNYKYRGLSKNVWSLCTNSYIMFGGSNNTTPTTNPSSPFFDKFGVSAGDRSSRGFFYRTTGTSGSRIALVRYEGYSTRTLGNVGQWNIAWEIRFYEATPNIIDVFIINRL
jgi:PKD repeat protein